MSKYATKAAGNMFCQARYEAAKFNERLSSREGAAEELGVDRTRLARIELGSVIPYPEEVLLMADIYRAPELKGKCFNYIVEQARKQSNGRSTAVEDQVVYEWAEDYYHKYEKPETAKKEKDKKPATTKKTEAPAKKVTEIKKDIQETKNDSKVSEKPEKKDAASKQRKTEKTSTKSSGLNGQISLFDLL